MTRPLSVGPNKVVVWSFPIIRNGLYVLRYTGRHARGVCRIRFLDGNCNLGDALRLAQ
jgi:hypothetical protein